MIKSNATHNKPLLIEYLEKNGYEYYEINEHQIRVMGQTHIIDIWPARMTYHRIAGEVLRSKENYNQLNYEFNEAEVKSLLERGE